jgi:hypothetical protein
MIAGTKYVSTNSVFDFHQTTHNNSASTHRIRSLDTDRPIIRPTSRPSKSDERTAANINNKTPTAGPFLITDLLIPNRPNHHNSRSPFTMNPKKTQPKVIQSMQSFKLSAVSKRNDDHLRTQSSQSPISGDKTRNLF